MGLIIMYLYRELYKNYSTWNLQEHEICPIDSILNYAYCKELLILNGRVTLNFQCT
jgi:hypothetical protein